MIRIAIQGFYVPQKNVFSFASIQFLTVSARNLPCRLGAADCCV